MPRRVLLKHSTTVGRRGGAFPGLLAPKDPDVLAGAASNLRNRADKMQADADLEGMYEPDGVPAQSYTRLARMMAADSRRYLKTAWLRRQAGL